MRIINSSLRTGADLTICRPRWQVIILPNYLFKDMAVCKGEVDNAVFCLGLRW